MWFGFGLIMVLFKLVGWRFSMFVVVMVYLVI